MRVNKVWAILGAAILVLALVLSVSALAGLVPFVSAAQTDSPLAAPRAQSASTGHVIVVGEGSVKLEPNIAQANIGVEVTNSTVKDASAAAGELMTALLAALKEAGVADKDIQTSGFNIFADRGFGPAGQDGEPIYRVSNNVMVTIRDLESVGDVLDAAIDAGANNIYGVNFSLDDDNAAQSAARAQAITNAEAKAQELAGLSGLELGNVLSVSEIIGSSGGFFAGGVRQSVAMANGMGGGGPISPGELEVSVQLEVVYELR